MALAGNFGDPASSEGATPSMRTTLISSLGGAEPQQRPKFFVAKPSVSTESELPPLSLETPQNPHKGIQKDFVKNIRLSATGVASRAPCTFIDVFKEAVAKGGDKLAMAVERPAGGLEAAGPEALPADQWTTWTWKQYGADVDRTAWAFAGLGTERHDSVGVWGFNSPEWLMACMGAMKIGSPPAGIYPTDTPDQVVYKLDHSDSKVCVVEDEGKIARLTKVVDKIPLLKAIVVYGGAPREFAALKRKDGSEVAVMHWKAMIQKGTEATPQILQQVAAREKSVQPGSCAVLVYTSGTTGNPKAVMTSHDNVVYEVSCMGVHTPEIGAKPEQERLISYLPLSHIAGFTLDVAIPAWFTATCPGHFTVYFARPNDLKEGSIGKRLQFVKPTFFFGVPRVYEKMQEKMKAVGASTKGLKKMIATWAKSKGLKKAQRSQIGYKDHDVDTYIRIPLGYRLADTLVFNKIKMALGLEHCKMAATGAAPISVDTLEYFGQLGLQINEIYGMSESTGLTTLSTNEQHRWGCCGFGILGTDVKIFNVSEKDMNVKTVCPRAPDPFNASDAEQGEICFRGRGIMNGYLANPRFGKEHMAEMEKKNAEAIDVEGWMHSGDKGCMDTLGLVKITGRYKELIIGAGGENIAPVPMEDEIKKNAPAISNVMMVGDKRKFNTCVVTLKAEGATGELPGTDKLAGAALEVNPAVTTISAAMNDPVWYKYVEAAIIAANKSAACPSNAAKIQKFKILPRDFSVETDEFTPTLKLKRSVVCKIHSSYIEEMYAE